MEYRQIPDITSYRQMTTEELREAFVVDELFEPGVVAVLHADLDRVVLGSAIPMGGALALDAPDEFRAEFFCQRRELGVLNIGSPGGVEVDGQRFTMNKFDCLYVGRGSESVSFTSDDSGDPAVFYLVSYPAHAEHPTTLVTQGEANRVDLGGKDTCNERTIYQYIHEGGAASCQLVMGWTRLHAGSVWNTMPCHTHMRRTEVYLYFDVPEGQRVLHLMGEPDETRALWMGDRTAALSPAWSIHSGCGTANYNFVWAMGGENKRFDDMDAVAIGGLR